MCIFFLNLSKNSCLGGGGGMGTGDGGGDRNISVAMALVCDRVFPNCV